MILLVSLYCKNKTTRKEVQNEMNREKRLIIQALNYLELIETEDNQPMTNLIRGLLLELLDSV